MLCTAVPDPQAVTSPKELNRDKKILRTAFLTGKEDDAQKPLAGPKQHGKH